MNIGSVGSLGRVYLHLLALGFLAGFIFIFFLSVPSFRSAYAQFRNLESTGIVPNGFSEFFHMRFSIYFPYGWSIMENIPNSVQFSAPDVTSNVIISWDTHIPPPWILDKSAWIQNMTKQGIIIDKIDNTTTIANHTALQLSFTDGDTRYSVVVIKTDNSALSFIYSAYTNDFPLYEDKANAMLSYLRVSEAGSSFLDSHRTYSTLFNQEGWWPLWHGPPRTCEGGL
jgi:hypothetical protein